MRKPTLLLLIIVMLTSLAGRVQAQVASSDEARRAAESWMRYIVQRDKHWAQAPDPFIVSWSELRRGDLLLGYCAQVKPLGYVSLTALKDIPPIIAYSTTSNLDPSQEAGISGLLKDVLESKMRILIKKFGGLDADALKDLKSFTPDSNRQTWSTLLANPRDLVEQLGSIKGTLATTGVVVGPLLQTSWAQEPPYNNNCPDKGCNWAPYYDGVNYNYNARAGCVPVAEAQIMRFFCWPANFDWVNTFVACQWDSAHLRFLDQNSVPLTQTQVDAVAGLLREVGNANTWISYKCDETSAPVCSALVDDARDAMRSLLYGTNGGPYCQDKNDHTWDEWWSIITTAIDETKPLLYSLDNNGAFKHCIVIDGYDSTGPERFVHANYGWNDPHNMWYAVNIFDCHNFWPPPYIGGCDTENESLVEGIFPETSIAGVHSGTISANSWPYVLRDVVVQDALTVQGATRMQFLPGTALTCTTGQTHVESGVSGVATRLFSITPPATHGVQVYAGGGITIAPGGALRIH